MENMDVLVIGGGLAGCEAANFLACHGINVTLYEMRPIKKTAAHDTGFLAELVCSNSLRSDDPFSAVGILKGEMRSLGSLVIEAAEKHRVPAGKALAVNRDNFAKYITQKISSNPRIKVCREEVLTVPENRDCILATGPLTSEALSGSIANIIGESELYFYDAIAPIISKDSIDTNIVYQMDRYGEAGSGDYLNCPMNRDEYLVFYRALCDAVPVGRRGVEALKYFEGCMPVEAIAKRGEDTLRFGAMKPVGLTDPRTGVEPYAVVQLRKEDQNGEMLNLVGFQTGLSYPDQANIFKMIPGLENADFFRYGSMHRNTFINAPTVLNTTLGMKGNERLLFAGQVSGVEGYVESSAMGILAGVYTWLRLAGKKLIPAPKTTVCGALAAYINSAEPKNFQPMKSNFGILEPLKGRFNKKEKKEKKAIRAGKDFAEWKEIIGLK